MHPRCTGQWCVMMDNEPRERFGPGTKLLECAAATSRAAQTWCSPNGWEIVALDPPRDGQGTGTNHSPAAGLQVARGGPGRRTVGSHPWWITAPGTRRASSSSAAAQVRCACGPAGWACHGVSCPRPTRSSTSRRCSVRDEQWVLRQVFFARYLGSTAPTAGAPRPVAWPSLPGLRAGPRRLPDCAS